SDVVAPNDVEACLPPWLPWSLTLAERDAANRAAVALGGEPDEQPTGWFARHGWEPFMAPPQDASSALAQRIAARRARTRMAPTLALLETANFKRRWYKPDYAAQEEEALSAWLADRVEDAAKTRNGTFTIEQLVAAVQDDQRVLAACEVLTGRRDFSLA